MRKRTFMSSVAFKATAVAAVAALVLFGSTAAASPAKAHTSSVTINVAIAYPAPPKAMLAKFTSQTGIKVNWSYLQWDDLQTKIAAAAEADTYFADVTDVDWSKVGEYYVTKWFLPLNQYFSLRSLASQYPQISSFERNGTLVGMPMDVSLLVTTINEKAFHKAGITSTPTTLSQYTKDLQTIKSKGIVKYPLDIPFAAAEGLSTYWYELTAAMGGQVLSASYKPLFTTPSSAGYKAMAWMVNAYKSGLVAKANLDYEDYQGFETEMAHGLAATVFSDYSGDIGTIYDVPSQSSVVGDVSYVATPGASGPAPNLGNPDGIGIPRSAEHVSAAVAFIKWMEEPANQAAFAGAAGPKNVISTFPLPSNRGGLSLSPRPARSPVRPHLSIWSRTTGAPFSPAGAPPWYPNFSNAVYTNLHSAAAGQESVASAISAIASEVNSLNS